MCPASSLLEPAEIVELGLDLEEALCLGSGMRFASFPIADRGVPDSLGRARILAQQVSTWIGDGQAVAIHCRAGIGRSSLIAACALVRMGIDPTSAFRMIGSARGVRVPDTDEQREWVIAFAEAVAPGLL